MLASSIANVLYWSEIKRQGGFHDGIYSKLTYKGKPLVRKDNELYYGRMTDPYVLYLQILTTTPVGDQQVADKVHLMLLSTDTTKAPQERVARQTTKHGLYNALDIGSIWLQKANAQ